MTSQPGYQITTKHILANISISNGNQTNKFGQLIKSSREIFFSKNHTKNEAERLVPDLSLFFKKAL